VRSDFVTVSYEVRDRRVEIPAAIADTVTGEIGPIAPGLHNGVGGKITSGPC